MANTLTSTTSAIMAEDTMLEVPAEGDDGGSSSDLSEPGDRSADEEVTDLRASQRDQAVEDPNASDTEAETERLEKTPQTKRSVLLTSGNGVLEETQAQPATVDASHVHIGHASEESSDESADEDPAPYDDSPSRKRKRMEYDPLNGSRTNKRHEGDVKAPSGGSDSSRAERSEGSPEPENTAAQEVTVKSEQHRRSQRSSGRRQAQQSGNVEGRTSKDQRDGDVDENGEGTVSNEDDVDMDEAGDPEGVDAENLAKTEENLIKKRTAMESLNAIENCFATLRDKLFTERLTQCQEELAMLERPSFLHPELVLMKEVIDRRRDQKVHYEKTLLKYKLESLQRESIAQRAQIQSQYVQTAGSLRDSALSQINKAIYQAQRERRNCEADVPDYIYEFNPKRSQQITQQMAYNEEVSLLSGVGKYVGFPAAPEMSKITSREYDEDLKLMEQNMTVADQAQSALQNQRPGLKANLSVASTFGRLQSGAEDHFLQQNAWANPQHPAHQMHRQASVLSRADTPTATPVNQKRIVDSIQPHGSASTIPDPQSGPRSSIAPTPATGELQRERLVDSNKSILEQRIVDMTPSRLPEAAAESSATTPAQIEGSSHHHVIKMGQIRSNSSMKSTERDDATQNALPKALPYIPTANQPRTSPPNRFPVVKSEESHHISRRSPVTNQYSSSPPAGQPIKS